MLQTKNQSLGPSFQKAQNLCFSSSRTQQLKVSSLQFGLLSPDEIQRMSVAEICSEMPYDEQRNPSFQGINDPRLGTLSRDFKCITCKGTIEECPGHFGHINLAKRVFHIGLLIHTLKTLRSVCFNCSSLLVARDKNKADYKFLLSCKSSKAKFNYAFEQSQKQLVCDAQTGGCGYKQPKLSKSNLSIKVEFMDENFDQTKDRKQNLNAEDAYQILRKIKDEDLFLLGFDKVHGRPEWMIIKYLTVAPPTVRPSVQMPNCMRSEDDLTYAYQQIIKTNNLLKIQIERGTNQSTLNEILQMLQYYVATLMDNDICGQPKHKHKSGKPLRTIRARLKGKEGRLRGNLMGKRVDFSSRTVITPDPNLKLDQLGVPYDIATNLTYPETVTPYNFDEMKKLIQNGPSNWPGAKYIIRHDDRMIDLSALKNRSDAHIEIGYKVERHIKDGDYVLFNRQPSLHKMSIMGHQVKILPYSTFRMNLSVTSPYNADFDGDEMNMHVPQSYETVAEIKEIMLVPKQIMNPQSNKPVMGIVQDSLLGCMLFTQKDQFITSEDLMSLSMWIDDLERLPQPAILKPKPLWTGKQIFSLVLPIIQYVRYNEDKGKILNWASAKDKNILIKNGELLCGQMTKAQIGNTAGGLVHLLWKEYGTEACKSFLSNTQCVINNWLIMHGFTVGVSDIIARKKTMDSIRSTLRKQLKKVNKIVHDSQIGKLKSQPGKSMIESFEAQVNQQLNDARDKSGNIALEDLSNMNRLRNMVQAGSKGNNINISQIMACVGQQNVEGKRIPFGFNKRTLPHFAKDDFGPESKGFVQNSYFLGLSPSELYFHAMGGREGLIDTAVKTAETGYISRRLMKAMEDVMVKYDGTVRTSKEHIIQFIYGEDGVSGEHVEDMSIDILKMDDNSMQKKFNFLSQDIDQEKLNQYFDDASIPNQVFTDSVVAKMLKDEFESIKKDRSILRNFIFKMNYDDQVHLPINLKRIILNAKTMFDINHRNKSDLKPSDVILKVQNLLKEICSIPGLERRNNCKLMIEANEDSTLLLKLYIKSFLNSKNVLLYERLNSQSLDWILGEIKSKFELSLANPGEMVGSIAAQGMGEPATQMTLNTFHFAGVSAKNVTLGVPRLKEIINVSKAIKTPSLKIFLKDEFRKCEKIVTEVGSQIEYTTLQHVVSSSQIFYDPNPKRTIIKADEALVSLYNEIPNLEQEAQNESLSPWVVRFELDSEKMVQKDLTISAIDKMLNDAFQGQVSVMHSDENAEQHVIRVRVAGLEDEDPNDHVILLKEFEQSVFKDMIVKGLLEIQKVTFTKHLDSSFDKKTGKFVQNDDSWIIETDGVCLRRILTVEKVDHRLTFSNDCLEIQNVLGIEAARQSLINELRFVLNSYGIYVNYRHLATLTDVMAQRGKLMPIARHGINRIDSGALRKCSFEETVEILFEAALYSENDCLTGITENIIMGQLAPMGTGFFNLKIDVEMLKSQALNFKEQFGLESFDDSPNANFIDFDGQETPLNPVSERNMIGNYLNAGATGMTSVYCRSYRDMTPGGDAARNFGFSPADQNYGSPDYYASPDHYHASPDHYRSPQRASPIYGAASQYQRNQPMSPIYASNNQSPHYQHNIINNYQQSSPIYSPNIGDQSQIPYGNKYQINFSPSYRPGMNGSSLGGFAPISSAQSPQYSPTQTNKQMNANIQLSAYQSPGAQFDQRQSPAYSPQSMQQIKQENKYEPPIASYTPNGMSYNYDQSIMSKSPGNAYDPAGSNSNGYVNNYKIVVESPIGPISSPNYYNPASPDYAAYSHDQIKNDGGESVYNPSSPAYGNGQNSYLYNQGSNQKQ